MTHPHSVTVKFYDTITLSEYLYHDTRAYCKDCYSDKIRLCEYQYFDTITVCEYLYYELSTKFKDWYLSTIRRYEVWYCECTCIEPSSLPQWRDKRYYFLPRHWCSIEGQVQTLPTSHNCWRYCGIVSEYCVIMSYYSH